MFDSEERRIAQRIKDEEPELGVNIMLRNGRTLDIDDYSDMVKAGRINPQDAYVYIVVFWTQFKLYFYYPFLYLDNDFLVAYLSKLGFYSKSFVIPPATGLKYITAAAIDFYTRKYLSIEVTNLDAVVDNANLRTITFEVLGAKLVSGEKELTKDEIYKILDIYKSQRLFAGYDFSDAKDILYNYYDEGNRSLVKEAARIAMDYDRIFHPYKVCYETRTWKEVDCWSIKF